MKQDAYTTSIQPLLHYFEDCLPLSEYDKELVKTLFHPRLYRKRHYILQEGDVCVQFNFVVRGCLRMYKVDEKGNVHILQFATENDWINDLGSFHGLKSSTLNIDALEDTVVFQISRDDLIVLYTEGQMFDRIFRVLVENNLVSLQERLLQNISSTAEERYETFLNRYPHLVNRLSQVQVAAFLGVTPEFLSRLRNLRSKAKS